MNNSQSNSQGQRWLDNMMEAIPKSEEGMVKEASTIADMMKSPELVFFKHRFSKKKPEESLVIEDSDEEGNADTANAGTSNESTSNGHTDNNYIGNNDNGNADVKQDEPENVVEIKIEYEDELSETNHGPSDVGEYLICLEQKQVNFQTNRYGRYKCPKCRYTVKNKFQLKQHYRIHTGEKPFQCKLCERKFTQKQHCIGHIRTHDDRFKFSCPFCDAKFILCSQLKKHITKFHSEGI